MSLSPRLLAAALIPLGVLLVWWTGQKPDAFTLAAIGAGLLLSVVPPTAKAFAGVLSKLDAAPVWRVAGGLFGLALLILVLGAQSHRQYLGPKSHDEHSYTLGATMLASGRLWEAAPTPPESFESFHILTTPVYASIYPPGTALLYVPAIWTRTPLWLTAVLLTALLIPTTFLLLRPLLGDGPAAMAAVLVLASPKIRVMSTSMTSQIPSALLGTAVLAAAAWWSLRPTARRSALVGLLAGLLAITRPQDAAFFLPAALVVTLGVWRRETGRVWLRHAGIALLAALPCLTLVLIQNNGLTGSPLRSGYWSYTQASQPGTGFLDHTPATRPATVIQQKVDYNNIFGDIARSPWNGPILTTIVRDRLALGLRASLQNSALAVMIPLGIFALARTKPGRPLLVAVGGFAIIYGTFTFFLPHYAVAVTPLVAGLVVAGLVAVPGRVPRAAAVALTAAALLASIPGINPTARDLDMDASQLDLANRVEADLPVKPAILLFKYETGKVPFHQEPVYNLAAARLDDNVVLRAHDLGREINLRLFEHYAALPPPAPRRFVYHFDRTTNTLTALGYADELVKRPPHTP